jgi:hypothetical protein
MATPIRVTVFRGDERVLEEVFARDLLKIGRLASAHVKLEDPTVARIHAVLEASGAGYNLIDMGSPDGTRVNDAKVSKASVRDGDIVTVGPYRMQLTWAAQSEAAAPRTNPPPPPSGTGDVEPDMFVDVAVGPTSRPTSGIQSGFGAVPSTSPSASAPASSPAAPWSAQPVSGFSGSTAGTAQSIPPAATAPASAPRVAPGSGITVSPVASASSGSGPAPTSSATGAAPDPSASAALSGGDIAFEPAAPSSEPAVGAMPTGPGRAVSVTPADTRVGTARASVAPPVPGFDVGAATRSDVSTGSAWGSVPDNLASVRVPSNERALEIRTVWRGDVVLDTLTVFDQPRVTLGDERKVAGWGPFQKIERCDVEVPSRGLPAASFVLAESQATGAAEYRLNLPRGTTGHIDRVNGTHRNLDDVLRAGGATDPSFVAYDLQAEETVFVHLGDITLQIRYVRRAAVPLLPWSERISYEYLNTFILVLFFHVVSIGSFLATPQTQRNLEEDVYRAVNRFAQIRLTAEERRKQQQNMLAQLKSGERAAKAAGKEGKAGRRDAKPDSRGRRAVKGKPDDKQQAQAALQKLFGSNTQGAVAGIFGSGGLGGELESALGGVTGARVGDQKGLGGLGLRGSGPGGGGQSYTTAGTGPLGTKGRGGGGSGDYGVGAGSMGEKKDRGVTIYTDKVTIRGSLPKEIIRRVIKQHLPQIRYCYEKELVRSPGIFGKVSTEFIISAQGSVSTARIDQTTLDNAAVEQCIAQKIRTWRFPKPKGGGIVVVKYPFVLKQSG